MHYMSEKEIRKHKSRHKLANKAKKFVVYGILISLLLVGAGALIYITDPNVINHKAGLTEEETEYGTFNYDKMDI